MPISAITITFQFFILIYLQKLEIILAAIHPIEAIVLPTTDANKHFKIVIPISVPDKVPKSNALQASIIGCTNINQPPTYKPHIILTVAIINAIICFIVYPL
nr:MAG TPA: hypothetical protein [Caudoviricetes sp.]